MADDALLLAALNQIRERGAIGEASLDAAVAHADRFVERIPSSATSVADLGSGGGLPGLVIAWRRPDVDITLIDRREARVDQLRRAVSALGLSRVIVIHGDVRDVAAAGSRFGVVTSRSFGPIGHTVGSAAALLAATGIVLISEPPTSAARMSTVDLDSADLKDLGVFNGIRELRRGNVPRETALG